MIQKLIEWVIFNGGLYMLLLVVFAETGLFVGFFLPGDSLLFTAGIYLSKLSDSFYGIHFLVIIFIVTLASILGNFVGYWFGAKYGHKLYERKDSFLFKKKHLQRAHDFYEKYGNQTVFLAKFLPIVRTFVPIVAGIVGMNKKHFSINNILGSFTWVFSMMLGGKYLEDIIKQKFNYDMKDHIEVIAIGIILITTLPVIYKIFFSKQKETPTSNK